MSMTMRSFVRDVLVFVSIQALIFAGVWQMCPREPDHYLSAAIDKRKRIAELPGPRVVLVGGSSVAFGFDSRVIESRGLSAVNMGHSMGLGLDFMLSQSAAHLRADDLVVVAPEFALLWKQPTDASLLTVLEQDPQSARYLDGPACGRLLDGGLRWFGNKLRCALHQVSTDAQSTHGRSSFDERGDFVAHRGHDPTGGEPLLVRWPESLGAGFEHAVEQLDAFGHKCEAVGAHCVLAMQPLRPDEFESGGATLREIERRLRAEQRLPLVIEAEDSVWPASSFFDPGPHLGGEAATERTRRLLDALGIGAAHERAAGSP